MTGFDLEKVRDLLADAFDEQSFDELLLFDLDITRAKIVKDDALNTVILKVLQKAAQEGWDALLLAMAAKRRPHRPDVQEMARKYGATLVGEFRRSAGSNPFVRNAYREFQLAPGGFPTEEQLGSLQKTIDPANPMFSMADWIDRAARIEGRVCRLEIVRSGSGNRIHPRLPLLSAGPMALCPAASRRRSRQQDKPSAGVASTTTGVCASRPITSPSVVPVASMR
jgi:hypothetical protein